MLKMLRFDGERERPPPLLCWSLSLLSTSTLSCRRAACAALVMTCVGLLGSSAHAELPPDTTARVLAGMAPDALSAQAGKSADLKRYSATVDKNFQSYEARYGSRMGSWARQKLPAHANETIFYPFSGPDLPTVHRLYPDASRYVLVALQTAGRVPDLEGMSDKRAASVYRLFREGLGNFARRGFFETKDMTAIFERATVVEGITGVMMAFAAREGYEVLEVLPIQVNAAGSDVEIHPGDRSKPKTWESVRLKLKRTSDGQPVTLDYLRMDLSNGNLKHNAADRTFVRTFAGNRVVLKAASHLMQMPSFSVVRDALLERAPTVLQDETGLAYDDLSAAFEVDLYGDFRTVNVLFDQGPQLPLKRAYATRKDVQNLPFKLGYAKEAGSCLQIGRKRLSPAQPR